MKRFLKSSVSCCTSVSDYKEKAVVEELPNEGPVLEVGDLGGSGLKALLAAFFKTEKISEADVVKGQGTLRYPQPEGVPKNYECWWACRSYH